MTVATTIYLKRRDLVAHGACEEGLARIDGCLRLSSDPAIPGWAVQRGVLVRGSAEVSA